MIKVRKTRPEDFDEIFIAGQPATAAREMALVGDALTFCKNGKVLSVVGITPLWQGVGQLWQVVDENIEGSVVELVKAGKKHLAENAQRNGYHRIHSIVAPIPRFVKWAEIHGFIHESTMLRGAPDGTNMYVMAYFPHIQEKKNAG